MGVGVCVRGPKAALYREGQAVMRRVYAVLRLLFLHSLRAAPPRPVQHPDGVMSPATSECFPATAEQSKAACKCAVAAVKTYQTPRGANPSHVPACGASTRPVAPLPSMRTPHTVGPLSPFSPPPPTNDAFSAPSLPCLAVRIGCSARCE